MANRESLAAWLVRLLLPAVGVAFSVGISVYLLAKLWS